MNPLPLTIISQNSLKVTVGWMPPAGVIGYRFYRDAQPTSSSWQPAQYVQPDGTARVSFGLPDQQQHTFAVVAVGGLAQGVVTVNGQTPPPPAGKLWGISPSNNGGYSPAITTQMAEYVKLGATCPRIHADDTVATAALAAGISKWFAWMDQGASVSSAVAYLQKYPQCLGLEIGNESNLNGMTAAQVANVQKAFYAAAKAVGVEARVLLSSVGNNISSVERLSMLDWCKALDANGCKRGTGFSIANYHNYGGDPVVADTWQECWTVGRHGTSAQQVFGKPPFVVTEFGAKIGKDVNTAAEQAASATAWVSHLESIPECLGGHWFQAFDGTGWAGYGLIDSSGNRRPSWQTFHDAIA